LLKLFILWRRWCSTRTCLTDEHNSSVPARDISGSANMPSAVASLAWYVHHLILPSPRQRQHSTITLYSGSIFPRVMYLSLWAFFLFYLFSVYTLLWPDCVCVYDLGFLLSDPLKASAVVPTSCIKRAL
jgi:hypothetical protein